jgi:hypothetical protein
MLSYFLELLAMYVFLKYFDRNYIVAITTICALVILSTLNRESSLLTASLIITLLVSREGLTDRAIVAGLSILLSFLITYISLHLFLSPGLPQVPAFDAGNYRSYINYLGLLFWLLFFYLSLAISNTKINRQLIIAYHLISLPYILVILISGILWEVRLYMPLLLGSLFLAKVDDSYLKFSPEQILRQLIAQLPGV